MDEIELLKKLKKSSKKINILIVLFSLLIAIISFIVFPSKTAFLTSICIIILGLIMGSINFIAYLIICFKYKLVSSKIESPKIYKEYLRDVCNLYSPAIVSILHNNNTEIYRDYTATILLLYIKKYISIDWKEDIKINKGENTDLTRLKLHEKYVYECLIDNVKFEEEKFEKIILTDTENVGLIEQQNKVIGIIKLIIVFLIYSTILVLSIINNEPELMSVILLLLIPIISIKKKILERFINKYKITSKGKKELKKIKALKNFIKDYTLIEEYIKQNEVYRNLIYKGKEN